MATYQTIMTPYQPIMPTLLPSPYSILSNIKNIVLQFTRCNCGQVYVCFRNNRVIFTIPTVRNALNNGRSRKAPPTCFILFRNVIQDCVTSINLRIERHDLSKHAGNLWRQLKTVDKKLIDEFQRVARLAAQQFYSERIRIINVNVPVTVNTTINDETDFKDIQELLNDLFVEALPLPFFHN
ncbi:hypothetical protein C2G38_2116771 [Gigaspora rosea]|uniref:HMG box domain-containing protein n=1 Tax=Gigaspora rosea TaxID=44941 RepID=A0A397U7F2_9GLOM|nr:hypothetical protein C2G38_2116771 [Gigaspora rosea]